MKILFIGQVAEGQTSRMRMEVLQELGHSVVPLNSHLKWHEVKLISRQVQQKISRGPIIKSLNSELLRLSGQYKPDLLWAEKQEYLYPETLNRLKALGIKLLHYTPDPYFSLKWKRTKLMDQCLPLFDYVVTSKRYELAEYRKVCRQVIFTPLGYSEAVHRPLAPRNRELARKFTSDVGFLGGWEPRRESLLSLVASTGCNLKIWGYSWDHLIDGGWTPRRALRLRLLAGSEPYRIQKNEQIRGALQGDEVYGDEYAWALSGAGIGVGFLRRICPDQHTTRTFEIPACGSMMLADRTDEHQEFFEEGKEAEFFSSEEELTDKTSFYLKNEGLRQKIALAGYWRSIRSGYSYRNRVTHILEQMK